MRAFLFEAGNHQALTIDQAARNLPRSDNGDWRFCRALDIRELTAFQMKCLAAEDFFLIAR